MHRPYLNQLNIATNSTLDFNKVCWSRRVQGNDLIIVASYEGVTGEDIIERRTWVMLTPVAKNLVLRAMVITAASNLVDNWRQSNELQAG